MNNLQDLHQSIKLSEELATENYQARNRRTDLNVPGECNHYFPKYDSEGNRDGELILYCKLFRTVNGDLRYTYRLNGKRIAKRNIHDQFLKLGGFRFGPC